MRGLVKRNLAKLPRYFDNISFPAHKGESRDVAIACPFEPERKAVDLEAKLLPVRQKNAVAKFWPGPYHLQGPSRARGADDAAQTTRT
jgi:hypothetical protein